MLTRADVNIYIYVGVGISVSWNDVFLCVLCSMQHIVDLDTLCLERLS